MDEVTWIEASPRHRDQVQRQRVEGRVVRVGRAWDNDLVLDDPHVAAHHARIERDDDGRWFAHDLGSTNGLQVDGRRGRTRVAEFVPGAAVRIGHTVVRLHRASDAVAAELPLGRRSPWPFAIGGVLALVALVTLEGWLGQTGPAKLLPFVTANVTIVLVLLVWSGAWALASRLAAGHPRLGAHLLVAVVALLVFDLYDVAGDLLSFALAWPGPARATWVAAWIALAATCFAHLRVIGARRLRLKALAVAALAALALATHALRVSDWRSEYGRTALVEQLAPPGVRLVAPESTDAFLAAATALRTDLDEARTQAPGVGPDDE
jgi:hypothetical protein